MKAEWGNLLIQKRFGVRQKTRPKIQRDSVTEYGGIDNLSERLLVEDKKISCGKPASAIEECEELDEAEILAERLIPALDITLTIPPRVPHGEMSRDLFKEVEAKIFNRWKRKQKCSLFERNLEIWRQFWITCERSDVIIQILDARNPEFFLNDDIRTLYPQKQHILLVNKADLSPNRRDMKGYRCFYYSALDNSGLYELLSEFRNVTIGFIGYPNVGKSSTVNLITGGKKVKVSHTPGKTKYIQTIPLENGVHLLDCPGLVFPRHRKIDLILHGVLNVDQLLDLNSNLDYVVDFIGIDKLCGFYSLKGFYNDSRYSKGTNYIELMSTEKGWERSRCLKNIVKDFVSGRISYEKKEEKTETKFDWYETENRC